MQVVAILLDARGASEPQEIGESLGGHERDRRAGPLQDDVGGQGRPVHEAGDVGGVDARVVEHLRHTTEDAVDRVRRRGGDLGGVHRARAVGEDEVGERAADVGREHPPSPVTS